MLLLLSTGWNWKRTLWFRSNNNNHNNYHYDIMDWIAFCKIASWYENEKRTPWERAPSYLDFHSCAVVIWWWDGERTKPLKRATSFNLKNFKLLPFVSRQIRQIRNCLVECNGKWKLKWEKKFIIWEGKNSHEKKTQKTLDTFRLL